MKINYFNQPKDVKLGDILIEKLSSNFEKVWLVSGFTKDTGIDVLIDALKNSKIGEKNVFLGVDKKNTSKDMLLKLLAAGANLKTIINNDDNKIETRIYLFSNSKGNSYAYFAASKLSEGGLTENGCLITEVIYEETEYAEVKELILKIEEEFLLRETTVETISKLAEDGEIVARITERKIPRISDMYGKGEVEIGTMEYDESVGISGKNEIYEDVDIDVELPESGKVRIKKKL